MSKDYLSTTHNNINTYILYIIWKYFNFFYAISSTETYKKNNAILKAGKIKPTIGTKIEGKNDAAMGFIYSS